MKKWLVITGPTASGKTRLAAHVAHELNGEVISIDSRQVFRKMNLGTGKDLDEYEISGIKIPYHLIDIVDPGSDYHVNAFQNDFQDALMAVTERDKVPVLCGGSGLYLEAVLEEHTFTAVPVNDQQREEWSRKSVTELRELLSEGKPLPIPTDIHSKKRLIRSLEIQAYLDKHPDFPKEKSTTHSYEIIILDLPREERRKRISERLLSRLEGGLIEEVQSLRPIVDDDTLIRYGLEYRYITEYLRGELTREQMVNKLETEIHRFAKRQMTWFRRMSRRYPNIHWLDATQSKEQLTKEIIGIYTN